MNDFCADIGYGSMNKDGEQLCGDHVEIIQNDDACLAVLADGMGSGVKASILSTLTSKILSTMLAENLRLEDCVETIALALPVCAQRHVAYSTFTVIRILENEEAEIIQYDNPSVILLRGGAPFDFPKTERTIGGKRVYSSRLEIEENDIFIMMSDGCIHASEGESLDLKWDVPSITEFMEPFYDAGFTSKTLATILLDECYARYGGRPGDDTTVCVVRIRKREPVNLLMGPPADRDDCRKMLSLFFSKEGKHIVCGGTTSEIAAEYLGKKLVPRKEIVDPEIPPIAEIDGVDLVTEGVVTMGKVLQYARDYLKDNETFKQWSYKRDGASLIARMLFEDATDIQFFIGKAVNPAHQIMDLSIGFDIKMQLIRELETCLKQMGKRIRVSYF
ncbi:MAG: SpoIIE family protein phosphatase [Clostridia bacterium]